MEHHKIGNFIAELRKEKHLTQQELGDKLFVTDKAVSKWERGLSLPDITLLKKLAEILDTEIVDILDGQKSSTKQMNVEEEVKRITAEISKIHKKKLRKRMVLIIVLLLIILYILFRNVFLGYSTKTVPYSHAKQSIHLGVPKTSFLMKTNDQSYSFKNLRNPHMIENEIKEYLKTLNYSTCNDTIYYYDEKDNFSIINYSVKNHLFYSTIAYEIVENDYCFTKKIKKYADKLGGLRRYHTLNGGKFSFEEDWDSKLEVLFLDGGTDPSKVYEWKGTMTVMYLKRKGKQTIERYILEQSTGDIEIKDDRLYYYRTGLTEAAPSVNIPEVSVFQIENGTLTLLDNYLEQYEKNIQLN